VSGVALARRASFLACASALFLATLACSGTSTAPKVPDDNAGDIRVADAGARAASGESYAYVTERPLAIVGLAEARGMSDELAKRAADVIADRLDVCATEQASANKLVDGAARIVAIIDKGGAVTGTNVKVDPEAATGNALLCVVSPIKQLTFPPTDSSSQRGFAVEAMWGRGIPHSKPTAKPP
jgi:hypothetical protein